MIKDNTRHTFSGHYTARDICGNKCKSISEIIHPSHITAFVGGGGKTSSMFALAGELHRSGAQIIITTTTNIFPVTWPLPKGIRVEGRLLPNGKLAPPLDISDLSSRCDYLLIESDGSKGLPAKAPAGHEPDLLKETQLVIAVQGLTAFGCPIKNVCHRPELVCDIIGKDPDDILLPEDGAKLLLSKKGQKKNVEGRGYAVILNQADNQDKITIAMHIAKMMPPHIKCAITSHDQERT